jgi:elongation factor G
MCNVRATLSHISLGDQLVASMSAASADLSSLEVLLRQAVSEGVRTALQSNRPSCVLMEPVMDVEVVVQDASAVGNVVADVANKRRGEIMQVGFSAADGSTIVQAFVPLENLVGYATQLRSLSSGRASFSMTFSRYKPCDEATQQRVLTSY